MTTVQHLDGRSAFLAWAGRIGDDLDSITGGRAHLARVYDIAAVAQPEPSPPAGTSLTLEPRSDYPSGQIGAGALLFATLGLIGAAALAWRRFARRRAT